MLLKINSVWCVLLLYFALFLLLLLTHNGNLSPKEMQSSSDIQEVNFSAFHSMSKFNEGSGNELGFILVASYAEQLTAGALNIMTLQCWASTISPHVKVVEPFLRLGSRYGYILSETTNSSSSMLNIVHLSDIYDLQSWNRITGQKKFAPLIAWDSFVSHKPRNLILVGNSYADDFKIAAETFAKRHDLEIVRSVDYAMRVYSQKEFRTLVYGQYSPQNTVVFFSNWGGIVKPVTKPYRVGMDLKRCGRQVLSKQNRPRKTSKIIESDGQQYMKRILHVENGNDYISVMFRLEQFALRHNLKSLSSKAKRMEMVMKCIDSIGSHVDSFKQKYGITAVFLAMDCGQYGSDTFSAGAALTTDQIHTVANALYKSIYGNFSSLEEWEKSFETVGSFSTAGYVAQLQRHLASSGRCLLTAGGGSFQYTAMALYKDKNNSSSRCGLQVPKC